MQDSHSCDPGSIPGRRNVFFPFLRLHIAILSLRGLFEFGGNLILNLAGNVSIDNNVDVQGTRDRIQRSKKNFLPHFILMLEGCLTEGRGPIGRPDSRT